MLIAIDPRRRYQQRRFSGAQPPALRAKAPGEAPGDDLDLLSLVDRVDNDMLLTITSAVLGGLR